MSELMTVRGFVATEPKLKKLENGTEAIDFRLACSERWYDREKNAWVDGQTNWFTVTAYRELARNVAMSFNKGEKVMVLGRLKIRTFTRQDGTSGTYVGLDAITMGHDLTWGGSVVVHKTFQQKNSNSSNETSGAGTLASNGNEEDSGVQQNAHEFPSKSQPTPGDSGVAEEDFCDAPTRDSLGDDSEEEFARASNSESQPSYV